MDLNITFDAGGVGGDDLNRTRAALQQIKALVESTEPFGTHLAKGSKVEIDGLMAQMRNLARSMEGDLKRVETAMKSAAPVSMRQELERVSTTMRKLAESFAEANRTKVKFEGAGGSKAFDQMRTRAKQLEVAITNLGSAYGRLAMNADNASRAAADATARSSYNSLASSMTPVRQASTWSPQAALRAAGHYTQGVVGPNISDSLLDARNLASQVEVRKALANANKLTAAATREAAKAAADGLNPAKALTGAMNQQIVSSKDLHSAYRGLASGFGVMWLTWGRAMPLLAGAALSHSVTNAIKAGAELDHTLTTIGALGEVAAADVAKLNAQIMELGKTSTYGPREAAEALKTLSLAGLNAREQMEALPVVLDFAKAGGVGLEQAAENLVAISTAFGYNAAQMSVVSDTVAATAAASMASVSDMSAAFRQATIVASQYGVSLQDTATGLALLAQVGIRGQAAGTALRQMYNELLGSSKKARAALEDMGISIFDTANNRIKPLGDIIRNVADAMNGLSFEQTMRALQDIGNERGLKSLSTALQAMAKQVADEGGNITTAFHDMASKVSDSAGFVALAAAEMDTSTKSLMMGVSASIETMLTGAFQEAKTAVDDFFQALRAAINDPTLVSTLAEIITGLTSLAKVIVELVSFMSPMVSVVMHAVQITALLAGGMIFATNAIKVATGVVTIFTAAKTALAAQTVAAAAGIAGTNAALMVTKTAGAAAAAGLGMVMRALLPMTAAIAAVYGAWRLLQIAMGRGVGDKAVNDLEAYKKRLDDLRDENLRIANSKNSAADEAEKIAGDKMLQPVIDKKMKEVADAEKLAGIARDQLSKARFAGDKAAAQRRIEAAENRVKTLRGEIASETQALKEVQEDFRMSAQQRRRKEEADAQREADMMRQRFGIGDRPSGGGGGGGGRDKKAPNHLRDEARDLQAAEARVAALKEEISLREKFPEKVEGMTSAEKRLHLLQVQLNATTVDGVRAMTDKERALKLQEVALLNEEVALEKVIARQKEEAEERKKIREHSERYTESIKDEVEKLHEANNVYGKGKVAIAEMTLAKMEEGLASNTLVRINGKLTDVTQEMTEAQRELIMELKRAEWKAYSKELEKQYDAAKDALEALEEEAGLLGVTQRERSKTLELLKIERDLKQQLRELDRRDGIDKGSPRYEEARRQIEATAEMRRQAVHMKDELAETSRIVNQLENDLTSAFMNSFDQGKLDIDSFKKAFKNMVRELFLKPLVMNLFINPIMGAVGGLFGMFGGGGGGAARANGVSPMGVFQNAGSLSNMYGLASNWLGFGTGAGSGTLALGNAASLMGGDGLGTFIAANGGWGTSGGGAFMSSMTSLAPLAVLSAPLIIGALAERNSRDRISGAAYATSGGNDPLTQTVAGSTRFDYLTGDLPDRAALLARLEELGAPMEAISDWNDRALLYLMESTAGNNSEFGINWTPRISNMRDTPDFYRGAGYAHPEDLGWWNNKNNANLSTDPALIQASRDIALSIIGPLEGIGALIGDEAVYRATVGFANRGEGNALWAGMNLQRDGENVADWVNMDDFHSVGEAVRAMYSTALGTLDSFDLPGWADKQVTDARAALDALEGENMGQEAAALYAQTTAGIEQMYRSIQMLIDVFPDFSNATQDAVYALAELMGGMDGLQGAYSSYIQNFWSEEERLEMMRAQMSAQLSAAGFDMPDLTDMGAEAARQWFRGQVEAQDANTESGRAALAALLGLAGAFAELTPLVDAATDAVEDAARAARSHTDDVWNRLNQLFNEQIDNWRGLADEARKIFDLAGNAARQLRGGVDSTRLQDARTANAYIDQALAGLRASGALPDADELRRAIEGARAGLTMDGYASVAEYESDQLVLAGKLAELGDTAGVQLSFAEQQIQLLEQQSDYWKKQIDQLRRTDLTITSIDEGVAYLANALRAEEEAKAAAAEAVASSSASAGGGLGVGYGQFGPGGTPAATDATSYTQFGLSWEEVLAARDRYAEQGLRSYAYRTALNPYWTIRAGVAQQRPMAAVEFEQFANGGLHTGGLRLVGERGPELEFTGPARYWSFEQSRRMLSGGGAGNEERLATLLQAVLRELGAIRADTKEISDLEFRLVSLVRRVTGEGNAMRTQEVPA